MVLFWNDGSYQIEGKVPLVGDKVPYIPEALAESREREAAARAIDELAQEVYMEAYLSFEQCGRLEKKLMNRAATLRGHSDGNFKNHES